MLFFYTTLVGAATYINPGNSVAAVKDALFSGNPYCDIRRNSDIQDCGWQQNLDAREVEHSAKQLYIASSHQPVVYAT